MKKTKKDKNAINFYKLITKKSKYTYGKRHSTKYIKQNTNNYKKKKGNGDIMEQRSLRILDTNKTFFSKITSTLTKILVPTKVSFNNIMINIKRNSLIKNYYLYKIADETDDTEKKEFLNQKYEDSYTLYLESIDKYIMDSIYKKVKNNTASTFERNALSKYYMVVSLKDKDYIEYKYRKQEYLLRIDYETVSSFNKKELIEKYEEFYISKMDLLYKGLLKNFSIKLSDKMSNNQEETDEVYNKIFNSLESYISEILPIKLKQTKGEQYRNMISEYEKYEDIIIGKLDERDQIKKKMIILGISRYFFTHSLPLIAAEHCYNRLLSDTRKLILQETSDLKKERTYDMLMEIMEEYNIKLLSTKVYWEDIKERQEYKNFLDKYNKIKQLKKDEFAKQKRILFLKYDLKKLNNKKDQKIIIEFKDKLVSLGAMKEIKNSFSSIKNYKYIKNKIKN